MKGTCTLPQNFWMQRSKRLPLNWRKTSQGNGRPKKKSGNFREVNTSPFPGVSLAVLGWGSSPPNTSAFSRHCACSRPCGGQVGSCRPRRRSQVSARCHSAGAGRDYPQARGRVVLRLHLWSLRDECGTAFTSPSISVHPLTQVRV